MIWNNIKIRPWLTNEIHGYNKMVMERSQDLPRFQIEVRSDRLQRQQHLSNENFQFLCFRISIISVSILYSKLWFLVHLGYILWPIIWPVYDGEMIENPDSKVSDNLFFMFFFCSWVMSIFICKNLTFLSFKCWSTVWFKF